MKNAKEPHPKRQHSLQLTKPIISNQKSRDYFPPLTKDPEEKDQPKRKVKLFAIKLDKFINKPIPPDFQNTSSGMQQPSNNPSASILNYNLFETRMIKTTSNNTKKPTPLALSTSQRWKNSSVGTFDNSSKTPLFEMPSQKPKILSSSISQEMLSTKTPVPNFEKSTDLRILSNTSYGASFLPGFGNPLLGIIPTGPIIHSMANSRSPKAPKNGAPTVKKVRELKKLVNKRDLKQQSIDFDDLIRVQSSEKNKFRLSVDSFIQI